VGQCSRGACFAQQLSRGVAASVLVQDFDCDRSLQSRVLGAENRAHASPTNFCEESVMSKTLSGAYMHSCLRDADGTMRLTLPGIVNRKLEL
jgi:hypothetical protein